MRIRKSIAVLLLMCLLLTASVAQAIMISPMYVGIDDFQVNLSISGSGIAGCSAYLAASISSCSETAKHLMNRTKYTAEKILSIFCNKVDLFFVK